MLPDFKTLEEFVYESNAIERIKAKPGQPLFDDHFLVANMVAQGVIIDPKVLHEKLFARAGGPNPGKFRTEDSYVIYPPGERRDFPKPQYIPMLMNNWNKLVRDWMRVKSDVEKKCHYLHVWILCTHPYEDGNGRVARLVWNMLRANQGLSWHIEREENVKAYYDGVRLIEDRFFKKEYPNVY